MSERPDVYISDITKSVVLEVRAGELVVSDQYPTFYTLRFPRVIRIRYDKDWNDGLNHEQLTELISNFNNARRMNKNKRGL
jgi:ATP-dependent DNA ligase